MKRAHHHLHHLQPGDAVPEGFYVLDYRDGERPRWTVAQREDLCVGTKLVLVDPDNGADDLFDDGTRAAVTVLTFPPTSRHKAKTLRSQPHRLGSSLGNQLCDLDQQRRAFE